VYAKRNFSQLCVPEPFTVWTNSGPNERAGFVDEFVTGPMVMTMAASVRPITRPATACGDRRSIAPSTTKTRIPAASASASIAEPQLVVARSKLTTPNP
jgi:hypothetical protein